MDRRTLLRSGLVVSAGWMAARALHAEGLAKAGEGFLPPDRVQAIVHGTTVIDMLGLLTLDWPKLARWQGKDGDFGESDWRQLERSAIREALRLTDGNRVQAARRLGIARATLYQKLADYPELAAAATSGTAA